MKNTMKNMMKKRYFIPSAAAIAVLILGTTAAAAAVSARKNQETKISYREVTAEYGILACGITKTVPVTQDVSRQTWDLDISAVTGGDSGELQIEEVLVSAGQQVHKGTVLFRLTQESVQRVRAGLQREILDTNRACELLEARQKELLMQASQGYESDVVDGKYADLTYSGKCAALQKEADDAKAAVDHRQNQVNENLLALAQAQQELWDAQKSLNEAQAAVAENYGNRYGDPYFYAVYENTLETAENMTAQLEEKVDTLTRKNETLLYEVDEAVRAYHQIVQELEKEKLTAKMERDTKIYGSGMALERYDLRSGVLDAALEQAGQRYQAALQKIRKFDASIVNGHIRSGYNGVIADILAKAGDTLNKNDILATFYDQEALTAEASLSEADYLAIDQDKAANIVFPQCPGIVYEGRITEVSATEQEGDLTKPCYKVIVTIQGDTEGIFEGKTCDVTFLTGEERQALYVPKEAVYTEGRRACVKVRGTDGTVREKKVETGFSDGICIEVVKGVSQGDIVLVESKDG